MKRKRIKSSNFPHSIKKKQRKQELPSQTRLTFYQDRNAIQTAPATSIPEIEELKASHTYKKEEKETYCYDFTNYRLIYVLGTMEPKIYLIFITIIALLIAEDLNKTERKIVYAFFLNLGDTLQTIVEQDEILKGVEDDKEARELGSALDQDFSTLFKEVNQLKKAISQKGQTL